MYLPGFRDECIYSGRQIFFYKRAQLLSAQINAALNNLSNINQLTMFADYRVPQTLRMQSIFTYSTSLAQQIDNNNTQFPYEIPYSCTFEVELRASTVVAVE